MRMWWRVAVCCAVCILAGVMLLWRDTGSHGWRQYPSAPKGLTLEGAAEGLPPLTEVRYDRKDNVFTINGTIRYANPVERKEFEALLKALMRDDRLGMSIVNLRQKEYITYGVFKRTSSLMQDLLDADMLLSDITFARMKNIGSMQLPDGYVPQAPAERTILTVVHFNLTGFTFAVSEPDAAGLRRMTPARKSLDVTLIPVKERVQSNGGYEPDDARLARGELHAEDTANVAHILRNQDWYLEHPRVQKAVRYGEAAAFCRLIRDNPEVAKSLLAEL